MSTSLAFHLPWPTREWLAGFQDSLRYLPLVLPFALATVIGGIDCAESASAAGDHYDTREVIAAEAVATLVAGVCGGVIQTTPYIGHPAYQKMGGRAGYTLATALFIAGAGIFGYFGLIYAYIPKAAIFPILVFVGLEITAQSFRATPMRHYPAVALACVPALAYLAMIFVDPLLAQLPANSLTTAAREQIETLRVLGAGFILTSVLWASMLASLIDRRLRSAATFAFLAGGCALFGIIHSPYPGGAMFLPWDIPLPAAASRTMSPLSLALGYLMAALVFWLWSWWELPGRIVSDAPESH